MAAAETDRQEEPFIANGLKERLGMRMERREGRENGVRKGTDRQTTRHFCKISFSQISLCLKLRRKEKRQSVCAVRVASSVAR